MERSAEWEPFFSEQDIADWIDYETDRLGRSVRRASPLCRRLLESEGLDVGSVVATAGLAIEDPSWHHGFVNRCPMIVRGHGDPRGRLGFWEDRGDLCAEIALGEGTLLVIGRRGGELRLAGALPHSVCAVVVGKLLRTVVGHHLLQASRLRIRSAVQQGDQVHGTVLAFGRR